MGLILVTGGVRSGKSAFAERLASAAGDDVGYVATAEALDDDMARRIAAHRAGRPGGWVTAEEPRAPAAGVAANAQRRAVLLDCLTMFVSNILLGGGDPWPAISHEIEALIQHSQSMSGPLIVVTNEVGLGVVPPTELGRTFRDLLGRANQRLAAAADEAYLLVAGLPVEVKKLSTSL